MQVILFYQNSECKAGLVCWESTQDARASNPFLGTCRPGGDLVSQPESTEITELSSVMETTETNDVKIAPTENYERLEENVPHTNSTATPTSETREIEGTSPLLPWACNAPPAGKVSMYYLLICQTTAYSREFERLGPAPVRVKEFSPNAKPSLYI